MSETLVLCGTCNARCMWSHTNTGTGEDVYACVWCGRTERRVSKENS